MNRYLGEKHMDFSHAAMDAYDIFAVDKSQRAFLKLAIAATDDRSTCSSDD